MNSTHHSNDNSINTTTKADATEVVLTTIAKGFFLASMGLIPIIFLPTTYVSLSHTKILLVVFSVLIGFIFLSLATLRSGTIRMSSLSVVASAWLVAVVAVVSTLLSGDVYDSFIGDAFDVQSSAMLVLVAAIITFASMLGNDKTFLMRIYVLLTGSAIILGLFHISRLIFGSTLFSFGLFVSDTSSLFGGWNDVAVFFGLTMILSLLALEQLSLTKTGKIFFSVVIGIALFMLAVINFFAVWLIVGMVSLVVLMYALTKDRFNAMPALVSNATPTISSYSLLMSTLIFLSALIFVISGPLAGNAVQKLVGVDYVEVRPSIEATVDIASAVYGDNILLGIGPNKFADAWRLYKDPAINETIFWATDFSSGSGFVPTHIVTEGILGLFSWVVFFVVLVVMGIKNLLRRTYRDSFGFFMASSSFVAALYLWIITFLYNPTASVILLAALFTGVFAVSTAGINKSLMKSTLVATNQRVGLLLILGTMIIIIFASSLLYYSGRHYISMYTFTKAVTSDYQDSVELAEQRISYAYSLVASDTFMRSLASYQLAKMNSLINVSEPTPEQQGVFQTAAETGARAAQIAIAQDYTDPKNWAVLGSIYSALALVGMEDAGDRALEAFDTATTYDPLNPYYRFLSAQTYVRIGDQTEAEAQLKAALKLKRNYTDALYLLSQLKINTDQTEEAINAARALTTFESNNPAAFYYLGVLLTSNKQYNEAVPAFNRAITLNPNYSNARYFLALAYLEQDKPLLAREQLVLVQELNPDNQDVANLIAQIDSGSVSVTPQSDSDELPVNDSNEVIVTEDDTVITENDTGTDLVVPINPVVEEKEPENESESTVE